MWAYESVFYQIYPLGFCGAPFENDGKEESRILKVKIGYLISKSLVPTLSIFHQCSIPTLTAIIPEITAR